MESYLQDSNFGLIMSWSTLYTILLYDPFEVYKQLYFMALRIKFFLKTNDFPLN